MKIKYIDGFGMKNIEDEVNKFIKNKEVINVNLFMDSTLHANYISACILYKIKPKVVKTKK